MEANKELIRHYFTAFRDREAAWWERLIAPDFERHDPGLDFMVRGPAGITRLGEVMHGAFSDIEMHVAEVIAEGDRVLVRLRFTGWHTGEFQGAPATGNTVDVAVMDCFRVAGGSLGRALGAHGQPLDAEASRCHRRLRHRTGLGRH